MSDGQPNSHRRKKPVTRWHWIVGISLLFIVAISVVGILIFNARPILHKRVVETLSARFKSKVELEAFDVSLMKGFQVSGEGLRLFGDGDPNNHEPGIQPLIAVAEFRFRMEIRDFLRSPMRVKTVYVRGLRLNLPPREQRGQMTKLGPEGGKIKILVDNFVCDEAQLIINTLKPGKLPLEFDFKNLKMTSIGPDGPMHFDADLTNPKPVGNVLSSGWFGPWQADSPRDTPVNGTYSFNHADLGTIKGIGGILSSTGDYGGTLDNIVVDGKTDTPDFRIATAMRMVPLHTEFHAIVDGTTGDTYLQPVTARILNSSLVAHGSVMRTKDPEGHRVELDVMIEKGRIEDLLKLAVGTDPPIMTGSVRLRTKFDLPPGKPDFAKRLRLAGNFQVSGAHFTNEKIQTKIDALSMRSQGKPKLAQDNIPDNVQSDLKSTFGLDNGLISFSQLEFRVPGTQVNLSGTYSLDGNQIDFHGKARLDAKLSHTVTGWKSILLKPADPFFSKSGAGTELPVKVTGIKSEPHFGSDFGHRDESKNPKSGPRN